MFQLIAIEDIDLGVAEATYLTYQVLSDDAGHVSASSLGQLHRTTCRSEVTDREAVFSSGICKLDDHHH